jgi:hypothetical protein
MNRPSYIQVLVADKLAMKGHADRMISVFLLAKNMRLVRCNHFMFKNS